MCYPLLKTGEFFSVSASKDSKKIQCDDPRSYEAATYVSYDGNGKETEHSDTCTTLCPGQRFNQNGKCTKCPEGTYSSGKSATTCDHCPSDLGELTRGACIACGGSWNGTQCLSEGCGSGQYSNNGVCTDCPVDLSVFKVSANEPYCYACGGIWDDSGYKCCPTNLATIRTSTDCQSCFGVWSGNGCGKCQVGSYGSNNQCIACARVDQISSRQYCLACGYNWSGGKCN
jgi:hypothetical protein